MKICVLGSTGSIGVQTLDVSEKYGYEVTALSGYGNSVLLEEQCRHFLPKTCWVAPEKHSDLKVRLADTDVRVVTGDNALCDMAYSCDCDVLYNSIMGLSGMLPTIAAIDGKKNRIALSNKETLVAGGEIVMKKAKENGVTIFPVDSEHSAIFQCLLSGKEVSKILLTASGGAFYGKKRDELEKITPEDALKHPNWTMGKKITIDCSTLMNKGLEVIEAVRLFNVLPEQIEVIIHRESIIHSMVEFEDGAVVAQLGAPDMRLPIQYAATYPQRLQSDVKKLDFTSQKPLTFAKPDTDTFTLLPLAYKAVKRGGNVPAAMNGANEEAVSLFLKGKIKFLDIFSLVEQTAESCCFIENPSAEQILLTDKCSRDAVKEKALKL